MLLEDAIMRVLDDLYEREDEDFLKAMEQFAEGSASANIIEDIKAIIDKADNQVFPREWLKSGKGKNHYNSVADFDRVLKCGADKVSVNSGAIRNPGIITEAAKLYGDQCVVLSCDIKRVDGEFRIFARGGRDDTGMEAIEWIKRCVGMGAGEVVVNSIDTDGVKGGFDIEMLDAVCKAVSVPVIASGGAGSIDDFIELFRKVPTIDAGLAASIFHFGEVSISDLKDRMQQEGIPVRRI